MEFKNIKFETRKGAFKIVTQKYPGRIPIVLIPTSQELGVVNNAIATIKSVNIGYLLLELRQKFKLREDEGLYLYCGLNQTYLPITCSIEEAYRKFQDPDGFLYLYLAKEVIFG